MKKVMWLVLAILGIILMLPFMDAAHAQNTVMRGEMNMSGKYMNIAVDPTGKLIVTNASNNQPITVTNTIDNAVPVAIVTPTPVPITGGVVATVTGSVSLLGVSAVSVQENNYGYRNITSTGTAVVKSGAGVIKRITINTPGVLSTMIIYDGLSSAGTKIATVNTVLGQLSLNYDLAFSTGLTIVTTGTSAGDITVVFK